MFRLLSLSFGFIARGVWLWPLAELKLTLAVWILEDDDKGGRVFICRRLPSFDFDSQAVSTFIVGAWTSALMGLAL